MSAIFLPMSLKTSPKKIIIGIDPGVADTGYGIIAVQGNQTDVIDYGSIKTPKKQNLAERLATIEKEFTGLIKKHQPEQLAIEKIFFSKNTKTALAVGQARGVVLAAAAKHRLKIIEPTPNQIKQGVTGYSRAPKRQIQKMIKIILKLKEIPQPDDAADALAVALYAAGCNQELI